MFLSKVQRNERWSGLAGCIIYGQSPKLLLKLVLFQCDLDSLKLTLVKLNALGKLQGLIVMKIKNRTLRDTAVNNLLWGQTSY